MIDFLLQEGIITTAAFTGIFNNSLLSSFKSNILEPFLENFIHHASKRSTFFSKFTSKEKHPESHKIRWAIFFKDFVGWLFVMFLVYLFWTKIIHPYKAKKN
jgi:large-conductance mechanosensitive channel